MQMYACVRAISPRSLMFHRQMSEMTHNHFKLARGKELSSNYECVIILLITIMNKKINQDKEVRSPDILL